MSEMTKAPTHYRLLSALKAIGPYLREGQCKEQTYLFDCLAACVNDKKSPEKREFWGWWMELSQHEGQMSACYHIGRYTLSGDWVIESIPETACAEINKTQAEFHKKLVKTLHDRFEIIVVVSSDSVPFV